MKKLTTTPKPLRSCANGLFGCRWLNAFVCVALLTMLGLNTHAQTLTANFTDGFGTDPAPLDEYPGSTGNGWGNPWTPIPGANILTASVISNTIPGYNPLNGGGNYLSYMVQGGTPTSTKNAVCLVRSIDTAVLNIFEPYTVSFDIREDGEILNGLTNTSFSSFTGGNDYISICQAGNTSNDLLQRRTSWWIKVLGGTTSGAPGLMARVWGFFDGSYAGTKETAGGLWINATNAGTGQSVKLIAGDVYHFAINVDPLNGTYEGSVTDLVTGVGFNTTTAVGRKLKFENELMSGGLGGDFFHNTNICFFNKENTAGWSNLISLDSVVVAQAPTNKWPPQILPIVYDNNTNGTPGWAVGRADFRTFAVTSPNYPLNYNGQVGIPMFQDTPLAGDTYHPYTSNFYFVVTSPSATNTLPASGIKCFMNGVDVSSGLVFGGSDSDQSRTNYYSGLQNNAVYTNKIVVTDSAGNTTTCVTFINTFDPNTLIDLEGENFDFDPAQANAGTFCDSQYASFFTPSFTDRYIQNVLVGGAENNGSGPPYANPGQSYYALLGVEGIDYQGVTGSSGFGGNYRVCMNDVVINNVLANDYQRLEPYNELSVAFNNSMRNVGTNMWFNYTHNYTNTASTWYIAYLRGGGFNSNWVWELDKVTSGYGTSTQSSNYLGQFNLPTTAFDGQLFDYLATDATGTNTAMLNLSGVTTLKLSIKKGDAVANGNAQFDATTIIPVPQPTITSIQQSGSGVSIKFTSIPNAHYTVQYKNLLSDPSWSTSSTVGQAPGTLTTVSDTPALSTRFYRISVP